MLRTDTRVIKGKRAQTRVLSKTHLKLRNIEHKNNTLLLDTTPDWREDITSLECDNLSHVKAQAFSVAHTRPKSTPSTQSLVWFCNHRW